MLEKLARLCYRRRWYVLILWIVTLAAAITLANTAGGDYSSDFSLPGTESQAAFDVLKDKFPSESGGFVQVVWKADAGVNDPAVKQTMEGMLAEVAKSPHILSVASPYTLEGARQVSADGNIAFAEVKYDLEVSQITKAEVDPLLDLGNRTQREGLQIDFAGQPIGQTQFEPPGGAELVGVLAAIVILLLTFGSVIAMSLPIMSALFGIGIGLSLVLVFANWLSVANFTPQFASMIGLGVGIDYALFIVTRYRQQLSNGDDPEKAVGRSFATAGRAVFFAGVIVVISMLGILLMRFDFVQGLAVGGAVTVFVTMLASLTLLPAMLGFVGKNIDRLHIPRLRKVESGDQKTFWWRWSRLIQKHPWLTGYVALVLLLILASPIPSGRLGLADAGSDPETLTTRRAHDLLEAGFGPGFDGPLLLAAEVNGTHGMEALANLSTVLNTTPGIAQATPPIPNNPTAPTAAIITAYATTSTQDEETGDLVKHLRSDVIPATMEGTGVSVKVDGAAGAIVDFSQANSERLPILIGVIIGLSFILLMVVFRSVVVPIKAAVMNMLSIGAAVGVLIAVFQWGWLSDVIDIGKPGPIEAWAPMILFTVLFGLSMDYEVFLLSRIREEYNRTGNNALSVAHGVANTGRVITAAAAIMIAVFLSFVIGFDVRQIKLLGLGLAVAVLVDATIVRMVLVPATMEVLGNANWWLPKWLNRLLPKLKIEETVKKRGTAG